MVHPRGLVVLALLAVLPAAAQDPAGRQGPVDDGVEHPSKLPAKPGSLDEFRQKTWDVIQELEPLLLRLDALRIGYFEHKSSRTLLEDPLFKERESIRVRTRNLLDELYLRQTEYDKRRNEEEIEVGASAMRAFFTSGGIPGNAKDALTHAMNLARFSAKLQAVIHRANEALKAEEDAYNAARRSLNVQRFWASLCGALAMVALAAVFVAWRRGRARPAPRGALAADQPFPQLTPSPRAAALGAALGGPRTTPLPAPLSPGATVGGGYRILKELGKGSLGRAYEAQDLANRRLVVVKRLRDEMHGTDKDLDRLIGQLRQVAALKHPNLAEVLSVFIEGERAHMVLEHVEGLPLGKFLEPGRSIPVVSIRRVLGQVAAIVDHAHSKGVLHGDLKPSNILVTRESTVKVSDFAVGLEARKMAAKLSWGEPIGSPAYMAPEAELGTILKESDVYSLGVILYEMLTGRLPFEGPNFLAQKREMHFQPPSALAQGLPPGADALVQRALQPEPQRRFHAASDLIGALDNLGPPA